MLATYVALHDIDDIEGFVAATIERSGLRGRISESEREELLADGILILYELAEQFEPHRPGYAEEGRFSGWAAQMLPRRLGDAWHRHHPEHRRTTDAEGRRVWTYEGPPTSLEDDAARQLSATVGSVEALPASETGLIESALERVEPWERLGLRRMQALHLEGYGWDEIGRELNVDRGRLGRMRERLGEVLVAERAARAEELAA